MFQRFNISDHKSYETWWLAAVLAVIFALILPATLWADGREPEKRKEHDEGSCALGTLTDEREACYQGKRYFDTKAEAQEKANELEYWLFYRAAEVCAEAAELQATLDKLKKSLKAVQITSHGGRNSSQDEANGNQRGYSDRTGDDDPCKKCSKQKAPNSESERLGESLKEKGKVLAKFKEQLGFDPCKKRLYDDYRSYGPWGFQFSAGYEYVSVDDIFQDGNATLDLLVHRNFRTPDQWRWRPQFLIHAGLTNAAEAVAAVQGTGDNSMAPTTLDPSMMAEESLKTALQFDLGFFLPFARFGDDAVEEVVFKGERKYGIRKGKRNQDQLGFLFEGGFIEVEEDKARSRYYGGLRLAHNPEWYFDILVGQTEGLDSDRLELRGQFPVYQGADYSRIHLGLIANLGLDEPEGSMDDDVVRIYVKWHLDVKNFFEGLVNGG